MIIGPAKVGLNSGPLISNFKFERVTSPAAFASGHESSKNHHQNFYSTLADEYSNHIDETRPSYSSAPGDNDREAHHFICI